MLVLECKEVKFRIKLHGFLQSLLGSSFVTVSVERGVCTVGGLFDIFIIRWTFTSLDLQLGCSNFYVVQTHTTIIVCGVIVLV